jgi:hypothetical protein
MLAPSYFAKVAASQPALHGESSTGESELVLLFLFHIFNFQSASDLLSLPKACSPWRAVGEMLSELVQSRRISELHRLVRPAWFLLGASRIVQ